LSAAGREDRSADGQRVQRLCGLAEATAGELIARSQSA
jgi:hypothetical protein